MSDNIIIERIWEDDSFFEIKITAQNENICAASKVYVQNETIDDLREKIKDVVSLKESKTFWQAGERGDATTPSVSLEFARDGRGHVVIDVYMELDDGGKLSAHNCSFYVKTEMGLLENFAIQLQNLKTDGVGAKAKLSE